MIRIIAISIGVLASNLSFATSTYCQSKFQKDVFSYIAPTFTSSQIASTQNLICDLYNSATNASIKNPPLDANMINSYGSILCEPPKSITLDTISNTNIFMIADRDSISALKNCTKAYEAGIEYSVNEAQYSNTFTMDISITNVYGKDLPVLNGYTVQDNATCKTNLTTGVTLSPGNYSLSCSSNDGNSIVTTLLFSTTPAIFYEMLSKTYTNQITIDAIKEKLAEHGKVAWQGKSNNIKSINLEDGTYKVVLMWSRQHYTSVITIDEKKSAQNGSWGKSGIVHYENGSISASGGALILEIVKLL